MKETQKNNLKGHLVTEYQSSWTHDRPPCMCVPLRGRVTLREHVTVRGHFEKI